MANGRGGENPGGSGVIDEKRVDTALAALREVWPADYPSLDGVIDGFPVGKEGLFHLLSVSTVAAEKLRGHPDFLLWLADPEICLSHRTARRMEADLRSESEEAVDLTFGNLRRCKSREMLRIALREVAGLATVEETTGELSDLADLCLREVSDGWYRNLAAHHGQPESGFVILGMGKLGGRELNYSSDIDLIFVYGEDGTLKGSFDYHRFFTRLAEKIVGTFTSAAQEGSLFRVDLRLRPEGDQGPLVRSLESMENYYAGFGETWERMALIKARSICGDDEVSYEFEQRFQKYIYPRVLSPDLLDEIVLLKGRIEREVVGADQINRNVKLGYGGIREIEFVVQAMQVVHGAKHAFLQERNTLKALEALRRLEILPGDVVDQLTDAYKFLRTVEHRLQIEGEQQTHTIPGDVEAVQRLAASLGYPTAERFLQEVQGQTRRVRSVFGDLMKSGDSLPAAAEEADLSFFDAPESARKRLDRLGQGPPHSPVSPRTAKLAVKLEPQLLNWLRKSADPDGALVQFYSFVEAYGIRGLLFEMLVTHPRLLELLVKLFDSSRFLAQVVLRRPQLIEEIARGGLLDRRFDLKDYMAGLERNDEDLEPLDWVRAYRRSQILRICLKDILEISDITDVHHEYSALAEACLLTCQRILGVQDEITIIAMGKFGGEELGYGADLDVVYVGENSAAAEQLTKTMTAQTAEGYIFPVDVRLRPEGVAGMLTSPLAAYEKYFAGRAQFWETQALTKVRPISGPLRDEFLSLAKRTWEEAGRSGRVFTEIRSMHERIIRERGGGGDDLQFKTGAGGLMELEFLVQGLQMHHRIWESNTLKALEKLTDASVFTTQDLSHLKHACLFLRRCESVLRRMDNSNISTLPKDEKDQARLASRMGFADLDGFTAEYNQVRGRIRREFERLTANHG